MSASLSLSPVSAAIYSVLSVPEMIALAPGGVHGVLPQGVAFPCVLFTLDEVAQVGGFGTRPGLGQLPEIALRVHVFSADRASVKPAQRVLAKAIELLATAPAAIAGYEAWAIFYDGTSAIPDEIVAGVPVQELVARFRVYVEQRP